MSPQFTVGDVVVKRDWKIWLLQAVANPLLAVLFVGWLFIPESHGWQLELSLVALLTLVAAALTLQAGTISYFAERQPSQPALLSSAYARALRHLITFALCIAAAYFVWHQVDRLDAYQYQLPTYLRSMMPASVRRHLTLAALTNTYATLLFILRWIVAPALLLPTIAAVAHLGLRGLPKALPATGRAIISGSYWLTVVCAALAGIWLASHLVGWRPLAKDASVAREGMSTALRFSAAYLTALASWLVTCSVMGRILKAAPDVARQPAD